MKSGNMHDKASSLSKSLCDGFYEHGQSAISGCERKEAKGVCSIGQSPKFAFVYHLKDAIKVYLKCDESEAPLLQSLIASNTVKLERRKTIKANSWEQRTPYFIVLRHQRELEAAYGVISQLAQATTTVRSQKSNRRQVENNELQALVEMHEQEQPDHLEIGSDNLRERVVASIVRRRGQPAFRKLLIEAYGGICAFTGCDAVDALEAAHIQGYLGEQSHHTKNGLLLRADCHVLFDLGLLGVDRNLTIVVAPQLLSTVYKALHGQPLGMPAKRVHWPDPEALERHRNASRRLSNHKDTNV